MVREDVRLVDCEVVRLVVVVGDVVRVVVLEDVGVVVMVVVLDDVWLVVGEVVRVVVLVVVSVVVYSRRKKETRREIACNQQKCRQRCLAPLKMRFSRPP